MTSLLLIAVLVLIPFTAASARHVVLRTGRPAWIRRRLRSRAPGAGPGVGATATEELHAFLSAGKRVQLEQRRSEELIRVDDEAGAPPHGVDLERGVVVIRKSAP
ncbi:DUF6191 domain-containing protein [Yinghuangia seranimata]|uniref:DUF6191 domain-containing protein n=1 Tax=Yinghuangia seranimata TaxID=408067 RepID=UPI00248C6F6B|nr:DUF6191 domain-containing protein [Yinghuangia seranimata]MDI2129882.1 DUF6191 domain-containing protein [Yinghuangia seranimata]